MKVFCFAEACPEDVARIGKNLGDRIRGTLGEIDPLNKVPA